MNHTQNRKNLWLAIVIAVLTVIIVIVDLNTPRGIAIGTLYVVPTFLSLWLSRRNTFIVGVVSALLTVIGFLLSPSSPTPVSFALLNRGLSVVAIALLVIVGSYSRAADYFSLLLQKRTAEQALREAEERYRSLVRLGGETGEAIVMMQDRGEKEGVHIFCNKIWPQLTSYSKEELLKMPFFDLVHPEDRQECLATYRRKLKGPNGPELYEMRIVGKHGNVVPVELTCGRTNYRWRPANVAYIKDITERKHAEQAVRESEERYRALVQLGTAVGEAIIVLQDTEQGECIQTFVSDPWLRITGYSRDELMGKSFFELVIPGDRTACVERHRRKLSGQAMPGLFEITIVRKDGGEVPIELTSAQSVYDGKEANIAYIRDITERKQMQEKLILTDRMAAVGQLAAGIAHELNNPLTSIIGFSELVAGRQDLPAGVKEDVEIINREAQRTAEVVKGLLAFARKQKAGKELVDIHSIIKGVLQLRSYEQRVSNIEVDTRFAPDLPQIMGNGAQLQQVIINLIINAEQAMLEAHNRGKLTIVTERVGDMIRLSIADDGPGISPENLRKLFTPFFTTKEVGKGTGLGLSICHGIVTEHGGNIHAECKPGQGATFVVELPIKK